MKGIAGWFRLKLRKFIDIDQKSNVNITSNKQHCSPSLIKYTSIWISSNSIYQNLIRKFLTILHDRWRRPIIERLDITFCIYRQIIEYSKGKLDFWLILINFFSLSQLFLISRVIIPSTYWNYIELDLIIMNFTKGQNFIQEFSRQTKQNGPRVIAWPGTKGWSRRWKIHGGGMGKTGAFPIRGSDTELPSVCTFV